MEATSPALQAWLETLRGIYFYGKKLVMETLIETLKTLCASLHLPGDFQLHPYYDIVILVEWILTGDTRGMTWKEKLDNFMAAIHLLSEFFFSKECNALELASRHPELFRIPAVRCVVFFSQLLDKVNTKCILDCCKKAGHELIEDLRICLLGGGKHLAEDWIEQYVSPGTEEKRVSEELDTEISRKKLARTIVLKSTRLRILRKKYPREVILLSRPFPRRYLRPLSKEGKEYEDTFIGDVNFVVSILRRSSRP